jgi:hypothetical protein
MSGAAGSVRQGLLGRKKKVKETLGKLNKSIIVIIDDIDRLPPDEAFQVIRLIKAVADFPGTSFLLAFDPAYLAKAFASKPVLVTGPRKNEKRNHIRQIVPPIYGKIFEHDHWRALWTQGFKELCAAEVLVVIGCSLIDTDFHLRALLSRVVKHRKKTDSKFRSAILVADTKTRRKWQKALKGSYSATKGYPRFDQFLKKELKV